MDKKTIAEMILNGASLSSVMIPDPALESNYPAHDETYKMKFIYLDGDRFFSQTSPTHRSLRNNETYSSHNCYSYSVGYKKEMFIVCPGTNISVWGDISSRYAKFEWKIREDYDLVWTSDAKEEVSDLREAILDGKEMKLLINDEDGFWTALPVDLVNLEQESGEFVIRTETGYVPSFLPFKEELLKTMDLIKKNRIIPAEMIRLETPPVPIFYTCYSNGTYYNYFDEPRTLFRDYKALKIFAKSDKAVKSQTISYDEAHSIFQ